MPGLSEWHIQEDHLAQQVEASPASNEDSDDEELPEKAKQEKFAS